MRMLCLRCGLAFEPAGRDERCPACEPAVAAAPGPEARAVGARPGGPDTAPPGRAAWERRDEIGFLRGFLGTASEFLVEPREAGRRIRTGGSADALVYALLGGSLAGLASLAYLAVAVLALGGGWQQEPEGLGRAAFLTWGAVFVGAALAPVLLGVGLPVLAVLVHLGALLVRAAGGGLGGTFRSLAYCAGSASLLALLPMCGVPLALLWAFGAAASALGGAHGVSPGRAAAAMLLPLLGTALAVAALCLLVLAALGAGP